jgi:hypothetical protein
MQLWTIGVDPSPLERLRPARGRRRRQLERHLPHVARAPAERDCPHLSARRQVFTSPGDLAQQPARMVRPSERPQRGHGILRQVA